MYTVLIIVSLILVIIAGLVTMLAVKQENKKMEKYKQEHFTLDEERKRSEEYEEKSVSDVVPIQVWTYIITAVVSVILIVFLATYF